ncbi:acyl-CoA thioesterase [Companilactobacillus zhongbaensis]|uniref:acyl-CoA thioesterase n=1 Tax=Companilactobacillus zhongbaensis TaxID=2486009 RepID=UPI000F7763C5|nr:hotdog domain-containing protein [Companilactobacillus zhongbaensis]
MTSIKCKDTLSITNHRVFASDLNEHETVFGGQILSAIDNNSSIAASRAARIETVTASVDQVNFMHPFVLQDSRCVESYVTGIGKTSIEVFTKIIGEHLKTGERFLGLTCFSTFVLIDKNVELPEIVPVSAEEQYVCAGYQQRKIDRAEKLKEQVSLNKHISLNFPWD